MNYKFLVIADLLEFTKQFKDYTMCESLFTILKTLDKTQDLSWLYEMDDRQLLTAIENAILKEKGNEN